MQLAGFTIVPCRVEFITSFSFLQIASRYFCLGWPNASGIWHMCVDLCYRGLMKRLDVFTIHGWALKPAVWLPLENALRSLMPLHDLYFHDLTICEDPTAIQLPMECEAQGAEAQGAEAQGAEAQGAEAQSAVVLGHSLGVLWYFKNRTVLQHRVQALVSVAGFPRFVSDSQFDVGNALRPLQRMLDLFRIHPEQVMREFLARASGEFASRLEESSFMLQCADCVQTDLDVLRLTQALAWLKEWDCRDVFGTMDFPVQAIGFERDVIVKPALAAQVLNATTPRFQAFSRYNEISNAAHLDFYFRPEGCAEAIADFLKVLL